MFLGFFFYPFCFLSHGLSSTPIVLLLKILITTLLSWDSLAFESLNIHYDRNLCNLLMIYKNPQCPFLKFAVSRLPHAVSWPLGQRVPLQDPHTCFSFPSLPTSLLLPCSQSMFLQFYILLTFSPSMDLTYVKSILLE